MTWHNVAIVLAALLSGVCVDLMIAIYRVQRKRRLAMGQEQEQQRW